jgi:hypothetical protein
MKAEAPIFPETDWEIPKDTKSEKEERLRRSDRGW